ncbi:MAG: uridine kinase [Bacteroidales bacterium]|jgi:uridine kinase|nr:uridine kinase [Bacteroidales bacterium]MBO7256728.1 uridine kinase [Bacteroidales bacterium]MBO7284532.1 uridine kinase [Bacteroidales bacterium]MBQ1280518.1 uridine kinase [Bacteroidales bacterium]MBQ5747507.1 uridine kinase [Bacteroidales bacterium]
MLIIGIAGGTGSGKSTVVRKISENFKGSEIVVIPQDSYYKDNSHLPLEERLKLNFDHPESIDFELLIEHLQQLREGKSVEQPTYSYITCTRGEETVKVEPAQIIIIEGILIFTNSELRKLLDILVYVDADPDDRLVRVISRDIIERGKSVENVLERYEKTVKPMHLQFIEPTKRYADLILPQGGHNKVGIDILIATIEKAIQNS